MFTITITPHTSGDACGQLADAELYFTEAAGLLAGLKLVGFSIWERGGPSGRTVTFPTRPDATTGERGAALLLRPIVDAHAQDALQRAILDAFLRVPAIEPVPSCEYCGGATCVIDPASPDKTASSWDAGADSSSAPCSTPYATCPRRLGVRRCRERLRGSPRQRPRMVIRWRASSRN